MILQNIILVLIIIVLYLTILLLVFSLIRVEKRKTILKKLEDIYIKIHNDIEFSISPFHLTLSLEADDVVELALEI